MKHLLNMSTKLQYFGTDGIRGKFGDTISALFAEKLGLALSTYLKNKAGTAGLIVVGRDTRSSGIALEKELANSLAKQGVQVCLLGIVPSPALALITKRMKADFGIMITASHNPASDNGFKFFDSQGIKIQETEERLIESYLGSNNCNLKKCPVGAIIEYPEWINEYLDFILGEFEPLFLRNLKIVLDTANGAMCRVAELVFKRLGANLIMIGNQPDGVNINAGVGSEYPEKLHQTILDYNAAIGIAYDGDGDRVVLCNQSGKIEGDRLLGLLALDLFEKKQLRHNALVATIHSNIGLDHSLIEKGIQVFRCQVGDKYVLHTLGETGATLGGEASGHIIFNNGFPIGDGLLASLKLLSILQNKAENFMDMLNSIHLLPRLEANIPVVSKKPLSQLQSFQDVLLVYEQKIGSAGRILVRYSGTENKLRILLEGPNQDLLDEGLTSLKDALKKEGLYT